MAGLFPDITRWYRIWLQFLYQQPFRQFVSYEFGFTEEVINRALSDVNIPELFNTIYSTRKLVKSELWELVILRDKTQKKGLINSPSFNNYFFDLIGRGCHL